MGVHAQRKWFEHIDLARGAADGFQDRSFDIPGIKVSVRIEQEGSGAWLTVIQEGSIITGDEPLLPDYEVVKMD